MQLSVLTPLASFTFLKGLSHEIRQAESDGLKTGENCVAYVVLCIFNYLILHLSCEKVAFQNVIGRSL